MNTPTPTRCLHCSGKYDKIEIARIYGKESRVFLFGYCSSKCYTREMLKPMKETYAADRATFIHAR